MHLQSGTLLEGGKYRIISTLGRGGFGITYLAEQGLPYLDNLSSNIRGTIAMSMSYLRKDRPRTIKKFMELLDNVEPVVEVLVADDEKTKITAVTDGEKTKIVAPQPKVEQSKVQIGRKPKLKLKTERPKRRWWLWLLGVLVVGGVLSTLGGNNEENLKNTESTQNIRTYKVGDYYNENGKQGVVFEVWDGGRHGKIVSLDQTEAPWDSRVGWDANGKFINGKETGANSLSDGKANTDKIMSRSDSEYFEAFVWCRNKGKDWYLPAYDELMAIFNSKSKINSTLAEYNSELRDACYWSSEANEFCAWGVGMTSGYTYDEIKCNDYYVRAVSTF